jgi:hypothetical protein
MSAELREKLDAAIKRAEGLDERLGALMAENDKLKRERSDLVLRARTERDTALAVRTEAAAQQIIDMTPQQWAECDEHTLAEQVRSLSTSAEQAALAQHDLKLSLKAGRTVFLMFYADIERIVSPKESYKDATDYQRAISDLRKHIEQVRQAARRHELNEFKQEVRVSHGWAELTEWIDKRLAMLDNPSTPSPESRMTSMEEGERYTGPHGKLLRVKRDNPSPEEL